MKWTADAEEKFKLLLGEIPVFMRPMAEQMGKSEIARVARTRGVSEVDLITMITGLVKATPAHMKDKMKEAMARHGIDLVKLGIQP
jgi:hypothetical protein